MTDAVYTRVSGTVLALSFFLTIIFSYAILRLKKGNEEAILEEKKFGDTIFNTSLDGVFIIYSGSNIVASCNKRALELFGLNDKREVEGTQIESWFSEDHIRKFTSINQMLSGEPRNWQGELAFNTKKGLIFFAYVSVVPLAYKETRYTKISILDISNVKMAEFELMKAKEKGKR
jgi:PAS domain S-box-containing protein